MFVHFVLFGNYLFQNWPNLPLNNLLNLHHLWRVLKFAIQISPLLNSFKIWTHFECLKLDN